MSSYDLPEQSRSNKLWCYSEKEQSTDLTAECNVQKKSPTRRDVPNLQCDKRAVNENTKRQSRDLKSEAFTSESC